MKLVIFNGSPRNKKSNSKILIEHFLRGYNKICSDLVPIHYLANREQKEERKEIFKNLILS
jgi:multimeric flavodoxin WrbA